MPPLNSKTKPSAKATKTKATKNVATKSSKTTTKPSKTTTKPKTTEKTETTTKRVRRVVNKESILADFDTLLTGFEEQMTLIRASDKRGTIGLKYFKSLTKSIKTLRSDVSKNIKVRKQTNRDNAKVSGFMKPVSVSKEICSFAGWNSTELHSRVDVTKFICDYIRKNDLQNPSDRRQIRPDKKLKTLLKLKDNEKEPLTYYSLQRHIQPHFVKSTST
jgi:chromatin remodeling complex protein RSC6